LQLVSSWPRPERSGSAVLDQSLLCNEADPALYSDAAGLADIACFSPLIPRCVAHLRTSREGHGIELKPILKQWLATGSGLALVLLNLYVAKFL
jgi:hypothetical protein